MNWLVLGSQPSSASFIWRMTGKVTVKVASWAAMMGGSSARTRVMLPLGSTRAGAALAGAAGAGAAGAAAAGAAGFSAGLAAVVGWAGAAVGADGAGGAQAATRPLTIRAARPRYRREMSREGV